MLHSPLRTALIQRLAQSHWVVATSRLEVASAAASLSAVEVASEEAAASAVLVKMLFHLSLFIRYAHDFAS